MSSKSVALFSLLLCLAAGLSALLFLSKDEAGAELDEGSLAVAQSSAVPVQGEGLDVFEDPKQVRDVVRSDVMDGRGEILEDLRVDPGDVQSRPFTGQVVGAGGQPVEGAEVRISPDLGD